MKKVYLAPQTEVVDFFGEDIMLDINVVLGTSGGNNGYVDIH